MLNDLAWRKVPRNIIRDENIGYISSLLPEHLRAAPMLLYFIMYCKADDEGVIDLEDGAIYSRLMMKAAAPEEVLQIALLMAKRKLLIPVVDGYNVYIIDDWGVPERPGVRAPRTMEERRAVVAQKIKAEQEKKQREQEAFNFDEMRKAAFFCPDFDKNAQNVVKQREEREIRENTRENSENFRENIYREKKEETHTEGNSGNFLGLPPVASETVQKNVEQTDFTEPERKLNESKNNFESAGNSFFSESKPQIDNGINSEVKRVVAAHDIHDVYVVFKDFFAHNCLGFQESKFSKSLTELAKCICLLEDEVNTAPVIALMFCKQFKLLTETPGYFQNLPLYPEELLKPNVYRRVLSMTSKILCNKKPINQSWIAQATALNNATQNNDRLVYDEYVQTLLESNIDPNGESPLYEFLMKKATAIK